MVKIMYYKKASIFLLRAEDAATHMRMQKVGDDKRSLQISVYSFKYLTVILLRKADRVLDTRLKLYTFKYVYPLLAALNRTRLTKLSRRIQKLLCFICI